VGIPSGGTVGIIYGLIILFVFSLCVGVTLSELGSAWPNAGGQYFWTIKLAHPKTRRFQAYICGYLGWAGAIFTSVSVALAVASGIVGMVQYSNPDLVIERWMVFVTSQLVNFAVFFVNIYSKILPTVGLVTLYVTLAGFLVTFVTVLACSSNNFNTSQFVFREFINETGWSNSGIAFIVGLINPSWAFPCLVSPSLLGIRRSTSKLTYEWLGRCNSFGRGSCSAGARNSHCNHGDCLHRLFHVSDPNLLRLKLCWS
jgi:choline transport protein